MNFKIENLKVLDGNYTVAVSSKGISNFKNKDIDLEYFIALEPDSSYNVNIYNYVFEIVPVSATFMGVSETHHWSDTRTFGGVCSSLL